MSESRGTDQWMKESIDEWFSQRPKPTQQTLDDYAKAILKGSSVRPVGIQGSLSYTVIVTTEKIVSFRVPEQGLGGVLDRLAAEIHGDVVPRATNHGMIGKDGGEDGDHPLHVVSMPYLPGKTYLELCSGIPVLDESALKKQLTFNIHLARYFARAWKNPQPVAESKLHEQRDFLFAKLAIVKKQPQFDYLKPHIDELEKEDGITHLYSHNYPQALAHDDLNQMNILVNEETFAIQGIIDWSLANIAPFGWDYYNVRRLNGNANNLGWTDYSQRHRLERCFWEEFFTLTGISDAEEQAQTQRYAILAAKLATIIHYCFCKNLDGTTIDTIHPEPPEYLDGWLGNPSWDHVVQIQSELPVQGTPGDSDKETPSASGLVSAEAQD